MYSDIQKELARKKVLKEPLRGFDTHLLGFFLMIFLISKMFITSSFNYCINSRFGGSYHRYRRPPIFFIAKLNFIQLIKQCISLKTNSISLD